MDLDGRCVCDNFVRHAAMRTSTSHRSRSPCAPFVLGGALAMLTLVVPSGLSDGDTSPYYPRDAGVDGDAEAGLLTDVHAGGAGPAGGAAGRGGTGRTGLGGDGGSGGAEYLGSAFI